MNADNWSTAVSALRNAKHVVGFSGAGMSAESGILTFRDADGFWQRFPPERFATWRGLWKTATTDPHSVADFVLNVVDPIARAEANPGHRAVAALERRAKTTVVTQNVDGLHQTSGSTDVLEVHGSLLEVVDRLTAQVVQRIDRSLFFENSASIKLRKRPTIRKSRPPMALRPRSDRMPIATL